LHPLTVSDIIKITKGVIINEKSEKI